jgi:hypothetical protein
LFVSRRREVEFFKTNSYLVFEAKYTKAKGKKKNISAKDKRERVMKINIVFGAFQLKNSS